MLKRKSAQALYAAKREVQHPTSHQTNLKVEPALSRGQTLPTGHPPPIFPKHALMGRIFNLHAHNTLYTSCSCKASKRRQRDLRQEACNPVSHHLSDFLPFRIAPHYQGGAGRYVDPILGFCILNREAEPAVLRASLEGRFSGKHCGADSVGSSL